MRGGFWPVLNRIMTACIWVWMVIRTNNDGKLIFGFLSSDFRHIGEVNVRSLIRTKNRELRKFCEAIKIILGALIGPKFINIGNTLPLSAHVDTSSLFSFFIFMAIFSE